MLLEAARNAGLSTTRARAGRGRFLSSAVISLAGATPNNRTRSRVGVCLVSNVDQSTAPVQYHQKLLNGLCRSAPWRLFLAPKVLDYFWRPPASTAVAIETGDPFQFAPTRVRVAVTISVRTHLMAILQIVDHVKSRSNRSGVGTGVK